MLDFIISYFVNMHPNNKLLFIMYREDPVFTYDIVVGPRLGNSNSKEQYAYMYR